MNRTKIKICGIKTQQDIVIMNRTKPDYAGFVFFEKSKRHLTYDQAADLLANLDHGITPVAVCVSRILRVLKRLCGWDFQSYRFMEI